MKELIKFMLQKKNELLREIEELKESKDLSKKEKVDRLKEYNEKVEKVQEEIEDRKKEVKDEIKEKILIIQKVSKSVKSVYPEELNDTIKALEEKRKELKDLKKLPKENYLLIQLCKDNIKTLEERFEALQTQIKKGKSKLESIVGKGKNETNHLLKLYSELDLVDRLNFKNITEIKTNKMEILDTSEEIILGKLEAVKQWCEKSFKENNIPKYLRRLPRQTILDEEKNQIKLDENAKTPEQQELRAGYELKKVKTSKFFVAYKNGIIKKEDLSSKEKQIIDLYEQLAEEYDYRDINVLAQNLLEVKAWCEEKFKNKPIYLRKLPRATMENQNVLHKEYRENGILEDEEEKELRLGNSLSNFKGSAFLKKVKKLGKDNIKSGEKQLLELYENILKEYKINENIANLLELEKWYDEKFDWKSERRRPRSGIQIGNVRVKVATEDEKINSLESEDQKEIRLGKALQSIESKYISESSKKGEFTEEEKEIIKLYYKVQGNLAIRNSNLMEYIR